MSQATFSAEPALPIAVPPRALTSWPTRLPTAPAAPDTKTVSPGWKPATRSSPAYAVRPGMPSAPRYCDAGTDRSTTVKSFAGPAAMSRHACWCSTRSPTRCVSTVEATTSPTAPPYITLPSSYGAA